MATYRLTAADRRALARMNSQAAKRNTTRSGSYLAKSQTSGGSAKAEKKEEAGIPTKVLHTVGDVGTDIVFGLGKGVEGIVDFGAGLVGFVGGLFDDGFEDTIKGFIETDWVGKVANPVDEFFEHSYTNGSKVGEIIEGAASGVGQMLPSVIVTIATGGAGAGTMASQIAGLATMGVSAAGTSAEEAYKDGASFEQGLAYGAASGVTEIATERLLHGPADAILGKTLFKKGASEIAEQGAKRVVKNIAKDAINEGFEEMVSEATNPLRKKIYKGRDALTEYSDPEFYSGVLEAGATGALTSIVYSGTVGNIYNKAKGLNGDITASTESIKELKSKRDAKNAEKALTKEERAEYNNAIEANYKNIEAKLTSLSAEKRAKYIKNYNLSGVFNEDGTMKATKQSSTEYNTEYYTPDLDGSEDVIKGDIDALNETDGTEADVYNGELSESGKKHYTKLKKMINALNKRSGNHVSLVVVDDSAKFDGVMIDGQRLYIRSDVLESGDFSNTSIHEYGHSVEGTSAHITLTNLLASDKALKKSAQDKFFSAKEYGITEENLTEILEKNARGEDITTEEIAKYETFTSEVGANLIAGELGNEAFIDKIVRLDESGARKIIGKIKDMKAAIKSLESKESREKYRRLRRAEKLFLQAAEQAGNVDLARFIQSDLEDEEEKKVQASYNGSSENSPIVEIEDNAELNELIANSDRSKYDVIRNYLIQKFKGHTFTLSDGRKAIMDNSDAKELSHKANKVRTAQLGNLSSIIKNAHYDHSEYNVDHDKFVDFHYYDVNVKYGKDEFPIWINVGKAKNDGVNHIYSITNKKEGAPTNSGVGGPVGNHLQNASSNNSIPQNSEKSTGEVKKTKKIQHSYKGEHAEDADHGLLLQARELEAQGVESEEIRKQTGWFKSYDGKWRYEIDDSKLEFIGAEVDKETTLGKVIKHDELFKAYPQLKDVRFKFGEVSSKEGYYDFKNNILVMSSSLLQNGKLIPQAKSLLIHEIQHAIQRIEGFARGGSADVYAQQMIKKKTLALSHMSGTAERTLMRIEKDYGEESRAYAEEYYNLLMNPKDTNAYWRKLSTLESYLQLFGAWDLTQRYLKQKSDITDAINKISKEAWDQYEKTAGEIEAYDVADRVNFTPEQRKNTPPDVDQEDVVFADDSHLKSDGNLNDADTVTGMIDEKMQVSEGEDYSEYDKLIDVRDVSSIHGIYNQKGEISINQFASNEIKLTQKWAYKFYKAIKLKSPYFRAWFGDWRAHDHKTKVSILTDVNKVGKNPRGSFKNDDTGWVISSSSVGYDETVSHSGKDKLSLIAMRNIDQIIEKSILLDTEVSAPGRGKKSIYTAFMHKFYSIIRINGKPYLAKMAVDESYNPGKTETIKKFYHVRAIEIEPVSSVGIGFNHTPIIEDTSSTISIHDLFEIVKTFDNKFKPKSVNEHFIDKETGLPKVFYLENDISVDWSAGVTVYQNERANTQPVYISSQIESNYEIKDNGDVIVYDAGQVKSAADGGNIGTFDRGSKKIQYSYDSNGEKVESSVNLPLGAITRGDQLLKSLDAGGELFSVPAILEVPEYKGEIDAEEELRKAEIKYLKGELKEAEYKRRLENAIVFKAKRLKTKELEKFYNATEYRRDIFKDTIEQLGKIENQNNINSSGTRELIGELCKWYTEENPMLQNGESNSLYDLEIADMIERVSKGKGKFTLDELKAIKDILSYFRKFMESYNTIIRNGKRIDAKKQAKVYIDIMVENRKLKVSVPAKVFRRYHNVFGEPMSVCQFADMYQRGFFTESLEEIREGAIDAANTQMRFEKKFEPFFKRNKKYLKEMLKRTIEMRGEKLSLNQAIGLYMALGRKDSHAGFAYSGFDLIVAETPKDTVRAHDKNVSLKNREATIHFSGIDNAENMSEAEIEDAIKVFRDSLYKQFSEADKSFIAIAEECYKECGEAKMKTDMLRTGYSRVISDYYYPLRRAGITYTVDERDFFSVMHNEVCDFTFTKESVKGAKQALLIQPMTDVLERHINQVSLYTGLAVAIDNYNILYNMNVTGDQRNVSSIKSAGAYAWEGGNEYFKKLLKDLKVAVSADDPAILKQLYGGYVSFALGANPKVWFTQWSSYIAAFVELDAVSLLKGGPIVGNLSGVSGEDVDKYSRLSELRNYDNAAAMAQAVVDRESKVINKPKKIGEVLMKPIGWTDRMVIETLFRAAQIKVANEQGLKLGSEENKIEAGKLLDRVILNTQQNALVTERSAAMRGSLLWRFFTTFSSDAMKLQARVVDAFCENGVLKKRRALIKADNTLSEKARTEKLNELDKQIRASYKKCTKVISTLLATSIYMYLIGMLFKFLYNKLDDEYEEKDAEGIAWDISTTVFGNMVGGLPVIRDVVSRFTDGYEIDNYAYSSLNELLNSVETVYDTIINGKEEKAAVTIKNMVNVIGQILGFPTRNIYNAVTGIIRRISPTTGYKIDDFFYTQSYNADLKKAIENGDEEMIDTIIGLITEEKVGMIADTSVRKEMNNLSKAGYSVLPRSIGTSVTYDGETVELTKKQQNRFKELYSAANEGAAKLVGSSLYNRADEEAKAKAIKFLYDTYYNLALQEVLDVDLESKNVLFAEAIDIEDLAIIYSIASGIEADKDRKGNAIAGSRKAKIEKYVESLRMSAAEKYLVMGYLGYKCKNGEDKVKGYVNKLNLTKDEKARLMEYCGYAA